jgi:hypothetical protein
LEFKPKTILKDLGTCCRLNGVVLMNDKNIVFNYRYLSNQFFNC